jgi:Fe-S cluster assembly protein SufD
VRTLSFASAGEHLDLPVYVDHVAPGCTSRLDLRGLVAPSARFVTNGRVTVHRGAVGTDADQQSRNLLLGEGADLHAKPELQIFCDDIKASHGNAIGALDEAQVHYLRSRGIVEEDARLLIISGFAEAVLTGLGSEVLALAQTRLREALAAAGGVA